MTLPLWNTVFNSEIEIVRCSFTGVYKIMARQSKVFEVCINYFSLCKVMVRVMIYRADLA